MQISPQTLAVLKNFSTLNQNLVINSGSKIETTSTAKDVIATFEATETFSDQLAIYNMNEFLGVMSAFDVPELALNPKYVKISQGKQFVNYVYAEPELLITPPAKGYTFSDIKVTFNLGDSVLAKVLKMSNILSAPDLSFIGDGSTVSIKVYDKKNPSASVFEFDTSEPTSENFQINIKIDKMKFMTGSYTVDLSSKKAARFSHQTIKLLYVVAVEKDSSFV